MNKKITLSALLFLVSAISFGQIRLNGLSSDGPLSKLRYAEMAISNLYVDSVDENKLVEDAIRGMLEKLDPHSSYSTAKEVAQMNESLQGNFEGIGVQFNMLDDTLLVIQPVAGGPSERVGIVAGDRIVSVNDTAIAGVKMSREEIMKRLRGPKDTKVRLGIVRRGIKEQLFFTVTRDRIPVFSVDAAYIIRPGIGYIRMNNFSATTYEEFMEAMGKLSAKGMRDLIIDLQDNGGGYLQTAVQLVDQFLNRGDMIVYTEGRRSPRREYTANGHDPRFSGRVCVLINELSASAAEIVTGAIQDQDRGFVVGRRSFGKGLVQRPIDFDDGSMMRLTIAHYYTPSGRCIQKPYEKGAKDDYGRDLDNRLKRGEMTSADSIHFSDSLLYYTLVKHRPVYGGGGIMPDFFVPLDTTRYTKFHRQLSAKNIITENNMKYIDKNRKQLSRHYKTFDDFNNRFTVPQSLIDDILADAAKKEVVPADDEELARTVPYLTLQLKALIARDLWELSEYYQVMNEENAIVQKALEVLSQEQP